MPRQMGATPILKSSPTCHNSCLLPAFLPCPLCMSDEWLTLSTLRNTLKLEKLPSKTVVTLIKTSNKYHLQNDLCDFFFFL